MDKVEGSAGIQNSRITPPGSGDMSVHLANASNHPKNDASNVTKLTFETFA
jgi:hypothetical protein